MNITVGSHRKAQLTSADPLCAQDKESVPSSNKTISDSTVKRMPKLPENQQETLAFLSKAPSYGLTGPVERIDTHAAIVFLVGDRAYKVKRAIRYPYLDYSTVELRRQACEAELILNRRTAPDLYLHVCAVCKSADGRLGFGLAGEPVDWLVVMRRFDQNCLFDRMADQRRLTSPLLRNLTDEIVRFHAQAEVMRDRHSAEGIRSVIEANRVSMLQVPDILPITRAESLYERSMTSLAEIAALLDRRASGGHVRRCHGDLHLRNICLLDQRPTLFDCIEFSDAIACIDVLYDLAFLLMDLWHRDLRNEANAVFNRYLDSTDETDGLAAIPLFISLRAAIRAHVEASAASMQPNAEEVQRKTHVARTYLALAEDALQRHPARLIAVGGLSGTGKSTLAQAIAPVLIEAPGARILRSDIIRKLLHGISPETRLPESAYTKDSNADVYRVLCRQSADTLAANFPVIADAVFSNPDERDAIERVAFDAGIDFAGLWLEAPPEQLARRLDQRSGDASDATVKVMWQQLDYDIGFIRWNRIPAGGKATDTVQAARSVLKL
jgi:aminoglycoside phosphotransferase family enzyme/predicted kinase